MQVTPPSRSSDDWVMLPDHTMIARRTLRQKLRDLGLHVAHSVEADEDDLP